MKNIEEEKLYKFFAKAFHELMTPLLEDMKKDLSGVKESMSTKEDIDRIERKIEKGNDRMDRHGKTLEDHEKRLHNLETS